LLIVAWCGFTARSAMWMTLLPSRPRVIVSPGSGVSRMICLPVFVVEIRRRMKLMVPLPALPVKEDADDVRRQRRDQRKGQRHMHIEPDFEQSADAQMPTQTRQRRLLLLEQPDDLLARLPVAAVRERQRAQRRGGR